MMSQSLFPLPLTCYEEFMLADDRPAYPMTFFCRLRWTGRVDRRALEEALTAILPRHPLLSAHVRRFGTRGLQWVPAETSLPPLDWQDATPRNRLPHAQSIDLFHQTGLRMWVVQAAASTDIVLQLHHACCDGVGAVRFVSDLFVAYAAASRMSAAPAKLHTLDPSCLGRRGRLGLTLLDLLRAAPKQLWGLARLTRFSFRRCEPLIAHQPDPTAPTTAPDYPSAITRELSDVETSALQSLAQRYGASVNEVLLRDLYLALADWRARQRQGAPDGWLRIALPVSLRGTADRWLPAANVVGVLYVERRAPLDVDRRELLAGIRRELARAKRWQLGMTVVFVMEVCRRLGGGTAKMTSASHCRSTTLLMNLGSQLNTVPLPRRDGRIVAGDMVLEGLDVLGPLRPHTCATLAVCQYAGKLSITLHYDSRPLSLAQAEEILATFLRYIRQSIAEAS